jgi:ribosomal protein S18 acetylase RimI-like enzyme
MSHDNNGVKIEHFDVHQAHQEHLFPKLVHCYQNVFADGPWHEWKKCPVCEQYWGKKDQVLLHQMNFSHCGIPLVDYWEKEVVKKNILDAFSHNISCILALHEERVVGFCWGYIISVEELEKYFSLGIAAQIEEKWGRDVKIAYQSELGVDAEFRGQKIAKRMVRARHFNFIDMGAEIGVVRTRKTPEPSNTYLWFKKLGYDTIASYPMSDGRVILAKELNSLIDF